jgi:hypothetical protein
MRIPRYIPTNLVIGILIFIALLFGGYFVGHTNARSTTPIYITDSSGSNAANVNAQGHLSVHIADSSLPSYRGPYAPRRLVFPTPWQRQPLQLGSGQCYIAFADGPGDFLTAAFQDHPHTGDGMPAVLVRLDRSIVWLENGAMADAPIGSLDGVTAIPHGYVFAFPYPLYYKSFAGVDVCWSKPGHSDTFTVELRVAGEGGADVSPEQMLFGEKKGKKGQTTFTWTLIEGGAPVGYELYGTNSTQVTFYKALPVKEVFTQSKQFTYSVTVPTSAVHAYRHIYLFKMWPSGSPTRVGPFGSWSGE